MNPKTCPNCDTPIPPHAPGGLCPACVLREADAASPSADDAPPPGEIAAAFPKLEILRLIGHGGMGFVYLARQPDLDRMVALKILSPALRRDPAFEERFAREARVLGKLRHPNIVTLYEHGESGGFFYLLMEYVDGVNLRQAMAAGRFTPEQALAIVPAICDALQSAHAQGVWHRDIKPENILLDRSGGVKIVDFGIARILGDPVRDFTLTRTGGLLGSAPYMAPEQHEKPHQVDHRADIYSLGVVIYEMLTGELPLGRFPLPSQRAEVGKRIDEIVLQTLEKERELRQQGAEEVKTDVADAIKSSARSSPPAHRSARDSTGRFLFLLSAGMIGGGVFLYLASFGTGLRANHNWVVVALSIMGRMSIWFGFAIATFATYSLKPRVWIAGTGVIISLAIAFLLGSGNSSGIMILVFMVVAGILGTVGIVKTSRPRPQTPLIAENADKRKLENKRSIQGDDASLFTRQSKTVPGAFLWISIGLVCAAILVRTQLCEDSIISFEYLYLALACMKMATFFSVACSITSIYKSEPGKTVVIAGVLSCMIVLMIQGQRAGDVDFAIGTAVLYALAALGAWGVRRVGKGPEDRELHRMGLVQDDGSNPMRAPNPKGIADRGFGANAVIALLASGVLFLIAKGVTGRTEAIATACLPIIVAFGLWAVRQITRPVGNTGATPTGERTDFFRRAAGLVSVSIAIFGLWAVVFFVAEPWNLPWGHHNANSLEATLPEITPTAEAPDPAKSAADSAEDVFRKMNAAANESNLQAWRKFLLPQQTQTGRRRESGEIETMGWFAGEIVRIAKRPPNGARNGISDRYVCLWVETERPNGSHSKREFWYYRSNDHWYFSSATDPHYAGVCIIEFKPEHGDATAILASHLQQTVIVRVDGDPARFQLIVYHEDAAEAAREANDLAAKLRESLKPFSMDSSLRVIKEATVPTSYWPDENP